ncbi:uncharacterized protein PG998_012751 [Apiospora kogelbergensis]|uniref:uncharacterized protein n=1 Tax=Apiospora kogelbergensis TaxID=1337665 RepID=UPI003130E88B
MASDLDSPPVADDAKVVVTFVSLNSGPHSTIPTRRIALRNNIPERIGRASKVSTKGFVATPGNAWFDSPVMSRNHAELIADFENKMVSIKDTGSLHGTFVEKDHTPGIEKRVAEDTPTELACGDKIRFGVEIQRGRDTFPPCEVNVAMEWPSSATSLPERSTSTNRFTVPDAEDDDELSEMSEEESVVAMEDYTMPRVSHADHAVVDLTQEGTAPRGTRRMRTRITCDGMLVTDYNSDVIDLTSEIDETDRPPIAGYDSEPVNWPDSPSNPAHGFEDHQQDTLDHGSSQDSNVSVTASVKPSSDTSGQSVELHHPPEAISDLVAQQSDNMDTFGSVPTHFYSEDDEQDDDSMMFDEHRDHCIDTSEDESDIDEDGDLESHWSSDDDDELLDELTNSDDSDGEGASDVEEPSYGPCFDADMASSSDSESDVVEASIFDKTSTSTQSPKSSPVAVSTMPPLKLAPESPAPPSSKTVFSTNCEGESSQTTAPPNVMNNVSAIVRQPSPSDAAMVKMSTPGPIPLGGKTTAQVLGEKTGKYEYFAARDQNKETVQSGPAVATAPGKESTDQTWQSCSQNTLLSTFKADEAPNKATPSWTPQSVFHPPILRQQSAPSSRTVQRHGCFSQQDVSLNYAAPIWANSSFVDLPHSHISPDPEKRTRLHSPEHDMTSAFTFQRSKLAADRSGEIKVVRNSRRMTIPALLSEDVDKTSALASPLFSPPSPRAVDSPLKSTTVIAPSSCTCRKRSFDEALLESEESEDDDDGRTSVVSHSSEPGPVINTPSPIRSSGIKDTITTVCTPKPSAASQEEEIGKQDQSSTRRTEAPPAKRRRLADFAACALGGAIGGAAVLVGLITSAPSISQM